MYEQDYKRLQGLSILGASLKMLKHTHQKYGDMQNYQEACDNIAQALVRMGISYDYDKFMATCGLENTEDSAA